MAGGKENKDRDDTGTCRHSARVRALLLAPEPQSPEEMQSGKIPTAFMLLLLLSAFPFFEAPLRDPGTREVAGPRLWNLPRGISRSSQALAVNFPTLGLLL